MTLVPASASGAIVYAGPAFFMQLQRLHGREIVVDCGTRAGDVLACLRTGLRRLLFAGRPDVAERLAAIADGLGGVVRPTLDLPLIPVGAEDDLAYRCRIFLRTTLGSDASV